MIALRLPIPILAVGLAACAVEPEASLVEAAPAAVEEVESIDGSLLVGDWQCREVDPAGRDYAGERRLTFNEDRTAQSEVVLPRDPSLAPSGAMTAGVEARWDLDDRWLVMSNIEDETTPLTPDHSRAFFNRPGDDVPPDVNLSPNPGRSEIVKLTESEMVIRQVEADAPIIECTR